MVLVSTIHKSKGREFDTVYMILNNYRATNDESKHVVYVGITRAKKALYIISNTDTADSCALKGMIIPYDRHEYPEPDEAMLQLTHKGVNLGYFKYLGQGLGDYCAGQSLIERNGNMYVQTKVGNKCVLKLSKSTYETLTSLRKKGFEIYKSEIRFMVYWKGQNEESEVLCVLPNIYLRKKKNAASGSANSVPSNERQFAISENKDYEI